MNPFFAMITVAAVAFWGSVLYLALRFVRAAERRGVSREELDELRSRVGRLEEELAAASTDVERLAAGERITMQARGRSAPLPPAT